MKLKKNIKKNCIVGAMFLGFIGITMCCIRSNIALMNPSDAFSLGMDLVALGGVSILTLVYSAEQVYVKKDTSLFYVLLGLDYVGLLEYILEWLVEGKVEYALVNYICTTVNFLVSPLIAMVFWLYQCNLYPGKPKIQKYTTMMLGGLTVLDIAYILSNKWFGYLYYIDENGAYYAGDGYWIAILCPFVILITCMIANMRREIPLQKRIVLIAFCITPILTSISTIFVQGYTYTYVVVFAILIALYGMIQIDRNIELARQEQQLLEKQTKLMVSQIQPHFLYNTLTVIWQLCAEDSVMAQKVIEKFSEYLRANMESLQSEKQITFEKELEHTKTYLWIEQMRFGDDLKVEYDIQCSDFCIPALSLQPIVENAVKHGICKKEYGGTIKISSRDEKKDVYVIVEDNGVGFDVDKRVEDGRTHVGIENVRTRLNMINKGTLKVESSIGAGTKVTIILPKYQENNR